MSEARTTTTSNNSSILQVTDRNGSRGTLDLAAMPPDGKESRQVLVRFRGDAGIFIDSEQLIELKEGGYYYPASFDEVILRQSQQNAQQNTQPQLNRQAESAQFSANNFDLTRGNPPNAVAQANVSPGDYATSNPAAVMTERLVVPVVEEELSVTKQRIERGGVRIVKTVSERVETVDIPLLEEQTEVERVAVNRMVESAPPVRFEGDVMVVPVLEEVIVTEKRLMLREELRIRKRQVEVSKPQQVTLRREEVNVERFTSGANRTPTPVSDSSNEQLSSD